MVSAIEISSFILYPAWTEFSSKVWFHMEQEVVYLGRHI